MEYVPNRLVKKLLFILYKSSFQITASVCAGAVDFA